MIELPTLSQLSDNPYILNGIILSIVVLTPAFTSANSILRLGLLPVIGYLTWTTIPLNRTASDGFSTVVLNMNTTTMLPQYLEGSVLSRWSFETQGPTSSHSGLHNVNSSQTTEGGTGSFWARIRFGLYTTYACRLTGTPWEVKNVPVFDSSNPRFVPSRSSFLISTGWKMLIGYVFLALASLTSIKPSQNEADFAWQQVPIFARLRHVSAKEVSLRFITSVTCWSMIYLAVQTFYKTLALISVSFGLSEPKSWPPLFGKLNECYSIRRFWGNFWHQLNRQRFGGPGYFFTYVLLRLRKGSLIARYLFIFATFTCSACMHWAADACQGMPWRQSGTIYFFCIQTLGIMLEDTVQAIFRVIETPKEDNKKEASLERWKKVIGYLWIASWLTWTSPAWFYPAILWG